MRNVQKKPIPLRLREFDDSEQPTVSICCITYNHAAFIRDCLEGFLDQECDFKVEIVVYDDASKDGTADILREYSRRYPTIIKPILSDQNMYSQGINPFYDIVFPAAKGKYFAWCEGDDYWIDPQKIQLQVDFLEKHADFGMVFTDLNALNEQTGLIKHGMLSGKKTRQTVSVTSHLIGRFFLGPPTWLIRADLVRQSKLIEGSDSSFVLALDILRTSKAHYIDKATAVYRILAESASHSSDQKKQFRYRLGVFRIQQNYCKKYFSDDRIRLHIDDHGYASLIKLARQVNDESFVEESRHHFESRPLLITAWYFFMYFNKYTMLAVSIISRAIPNRLMHKKTSATFDPDLHSNAEPHLSLIERHSCKTHFSVDRADCDKS